eukprot:TRINITY_DN22330_c0_g1_i1.p1 TRINITY_DN22330_c0_g1~~TRINITY_DN22330_c0_g1_i1.p1  ORF type:complete len:341 (+),score=53.51 TRINITY_DN22330_c0_g1_i1:404-1426(+)
MAMDPREKDGLLPSPAVDRVAHRERTRPMSRQGIMAALAYMACAVLLVMFNKAALSTYKFPCANVVTLLQMVCSNLLLYTLRSFGAINFTREGDHHMQQHPAYKFVPVYTLRKAAPLSMSYLFYMVVGMASIRGVNVPMYTALRRTTVAFTMTMEFFIANKRHSPPILTSVALIVVGAFVAGLRDLSFDMYGYSVVFLSNFTTAVYLATIAELGRATGLNSFGLMWCNGILCSPVLLLWTSITGELRAALTFPGLHNMDFLLVLFASCMLAFALNYTIFLNTALNSPLTQTMCGNLKDLGTVALGWIWFGGPPFDIYNLLGQGFGFFGSGFYAYCKLQGL